MTIERFLKRAALAVTASLLLAPALHAAETTLLNVSYDPTRELYDDYNKAFAQYWKKKTGKDVQIRQSHGGSGKQARTVIDGLARRRRHARARLRHRRARDPGQAAAGQLADAPAAQQLAVHVDDRVPGAQGQPQGASRDWGDLARPGVSVITPNPKTSGGARWNYLAAWAWALKQPGGSPATAEEFLGKLFKNVPVLDTGARGSLTTFAQRGIGDVLISWENEAFLASRAARQGQVRDRGAVGQHPRRAAGGGRRQGRDPSRHDRHRPRLPRVPVFEGRPGDRRQALLPAARPGSGGEVRSDVSEVNLVTIADFGGWAKAQATHFADGGTFDRIYAR